MHKYVCVCVSKYLERERDSVFLHSRQHNASVYIIAAFLTESFDVKTCIRCFRGCFNFSLESLCSTLTNIVSVVRFVFSTSDHWPNWCQKSRRVRLTMFLGKVCLLKGPKGTSVVVWNHLRRRYLNHTDESIEKMRCHVGVGSWDDWRIMQELDDY